MSRSLLEQMANYNPTLDTKNMSLREICEKIQNRELVIPQFQRDSSWTLPKSVSLLDYQLLGKAPVSAVSMNVITNRQSEIAQYSFIDRDLVIPSSLSESVDSRDDHPIVLAKTASSQVFSVIDGQQRLTTNYKAYSNHPDFHNVVLDISAGKIKEVDYCIENQIPVGILYNKDYNNVFYPYVTSHFDPEDHPLLFNVRNKFFAYTYHINFATDMSIVEQVDWFTKLNNAGTTVSEVQLSLSKLRLKGFDVYSEYVRPFQKILEDADLLDTIPQIKAQTSVPIACLNPALELLFGGDHKTNYSPIPSDEKSTALNSLSNDQVVTCFKSTLGALQDVMDFYERVGIHPRRIEYITFLVGYLILSKNPKGDDDLVQWYRDTSFTDTSNTTKRKIYSELLEL